MKRPGRALLALLVVLLGCARNPGAAGHPARYLYVWAGTGMGHGGSDFVAVVDADPASASYGRILGASPAVGGGMMPHHTEYTLPPTRPYFANDFTAGRIFLVDASAPGSARIVATIDSVPGFRRPHSFARLNDTLVLASLQFGDSTLPGNPGGIAEFDASGRLLHTASSADPAFPGARIRTYALELVPALDRFITTSSPMDSERTADVIQVWRLSDLKLLRTIAMPGIPGDSLDHYPFELRTLPDHRTVFLNTYTCGFFRITGIETEAPKVEMVYSMRKPVRFGCSVPILAGKFWVMPIAYSHVIVSLDLSDLSHPVEVSTLPTDSTFFPHWIAADPGSDRLIVTEQGDGPPRIFMARLDRTSGRLSWDERFREADSTRLGVSFSRATWPNGVVGAAMPHGALFVP